ncbi:glycoside hydrolase family 43 protein [Micromonospora sp. NPDC050980]|uniref:glycoside hydrolase family 43 protein n=1 Tax=Micromonospora sp. NPDC050980 TaxID=3155161 RepID=UPI0033D5039E
MPSTTRRPAVAAVLALLVSLTMTVAWPSAPARAASTFTNPIATNAPDPQITYVNGYYYLLSTGLDKIQIKRSPTLVGLGAAQVKTVFNAQPFTGYTVDIWAPEMHRIDNKWYIYFTGAPSSFFGFSTEHRLFVLENTSADPFSGTWVNKGRIVTPGGDHWAIDGTVFTNNGKRYLAWSGRASTFDFVSRIYLAEMSSPTTLTGPRVLLSSPTATWETQGTAVDEAPYVVKRNGRLFMTFSGSNCTTDDYALGLLTAGEYSNLLDPASWVKTQGPVFTKNPAQNVYGPGHNSIFRAADGTDWLAYHANNGPEQSCGTNRNLHVQRITYDTLGAPVFGAPTTSAQQAPAGE